MFGLRSARGRAILAGVVLIVLLAGVATVAIWRTRDMQQRHHTLEHTSAAATALVHAQAQFWWAQATLSALVFSGDAALVDDYHDAAAAVEQGLSQARAEALAAGEADELLALDALTERIGQLDHTMEIGIPILLQGDAETRIQLATGLMPESQAEAEAIIADLEELAREEQEELTASRASADRAAATTLWLLIGLSAAAFLVAAGTIAMLIVSVVRPLASLQASARAITSGDPEARARVSGPEEVTSLARDFNEMTDALAAKTQEYIDTANLTGVMLLKLDRNGRCTFLNDATCEFLGRPKEEILGVEITRYLHPEDMEPTTQALHRMLESKRLVTGVVSRFVTPLGIRVTEWNAYPLFDEQGHYAGMQATGRDITQRKQMDEALRESEQRYRDLFENANDLIQSVAPDTSFVYVNRAWREALGYSEDEIPGLSLLDIIHPDSKAYCTEMFQRVMAGEKPDHLEAMFVTKDGRTIWVEGSASCRFEDGKPVATRGIFRDITERKRAEEALQESEEKWRSLAENAPDIILTADRDGTIQFINRTVPGAPTVEETIGMSIYDFIDPDYRDTFRKSLEQVFQTGKPGTYQLIGLGPGGRPSWYESHFGPIKRDGQVVAVALINTDITQRKRAEEALQESEKRLSILFEFAPDAIYLHDLEGNFVDANRAAEELTGYKKEALIGKSLLESNLIPQTQLPKAAATVAKLVQGLPSGPDEFTLIRKDGKHIAVETRGFPVEIGEQTLILGIGRDITQRKRAEEALASSEERLRILFEFAPDAYYLNDLQGNFVDGNRGAEELIGYKRAELIGKSFLELNLLPPGQLQKAAAILAKNVQGLPTGPDELALVRKDGNEVPVEIRTFPVRIGDQTLVLGIARDITERKRAEDALRHSEELTRLIVETAQDAFISIDARGVITAWNAQAERTFGWSRSEAVGRKLSDTIIPPQHREAYERGLERFLATGEGPVLNKSIEITAWHHDGHEFPVELAVWAVRSGDTYTFNAFVRDISERKRAEEERERLNAQLEVRAITDGLTGLYNHAHFFQRLAEEIDRSNRYGRGFSILMMDVDNFKQFNDSRGHQAGDEALCLVADCIRTALRRSDIPFRYGGDEFAAMLLHADLPRAQAIAKRMNRCIARRLKEMNNPVAASLGLSTGVACFPNDGTTADDLVKVADTALYDAKRVASAHRAMQQGQAIEPVAYPSGTLDEKQQRVLSIAARELAAALQDLSAPDALADLDLRTIAAVGAAAEIKDPYIRGHQERVSRWAAALAKEMGLPPERVRDIQIAGLLHDLGKVGIGDRILNKPGKLTQEEYAKIKEHSALGAAMLASEAEGLQQLVPIVRHHHERFDGKGYPDGLAGEETPLEARVLSVVDVFDAMTHERSYRKALSREEAMAELERGAGTQFDPAAAKAFLALLKKRGDDLACPVHAASEDRRLATAKAAGRRKG